MTGQTTSKPTCASCGAEVPPDAPQGFCMKCLFALGTAAPDAPPDATAPSQPSTLNFQPTPLRSFGDYELLEEIARGGMGIIYRARQKSLGRIVAVKMLLFGDQSGKEQAQRFRAEAALAASLQHPNIVAIHEVSAHEGQPFFVMDFIEGQNLAKLSAECEVRNADWLRRAASYVKIVAEAIHYAHERGILHRDLKPSNVLIDPFDQPRVTDFGLAKNLHHDSELTLSGQVLGSPNYMPPEQAAAKRGLVGRRSDVYSLGAILYHLLTGRPPFVGETLTDTLQDVVNNEPASPRLLNPSVPRDLETLCLKCLEKEPARRYQTAQALAEELDRFLKAEPIRAHPIGQVGKLWRWCRRRPAVAGLLVALHIALAVGLAGILWQWQRAEKGELSARTSELDARQKAYASDMNLANQALAQNKFGRMRRLLDRHRTVQKSETSSTLNLPRSPDLRGWEWRYLWQHDRSDALFTLCQQSNPICSLAISPDGNWIAVGENYEGGLSIWDLQKREEIKRFPKGEGPVFAVFSPQSRLLAFSRGVHSVSSSSESRILLWDGNAQRMVAEFPLEGPCRGLAFSGDGKSLATLSAGEEGQLTVWRVPGGTILARHPALSVSYVTETPFAVARDMSVAAYEVGRDRLRVVDLRTGQERWMIGLPEESLTALALSPDGRVLASAGGWEPSPIRLWDMGTGKAIGTLPGHLGYACSLVFWPDGKTLASVGSDQMIRFWNMDELRASRRPLGHKSGQWSLALLPDNRRMVSGCGDGSVSVWDAEANGRASSHVQLPGSFVAWSFATNDQTVLTCDRQGRVARWRGNPFAEERLLEIGTNISAATFLPERSMIVVAAGMGVGDAMETQPRFLSRSRIQVWDFQMRSLLHELTLSNGPPPTWLCLTRGSRLIIGDAVNELLHEWNLNTWEKVRTWRGPAQLCAGGLSPDGRWCISVGLGGAMMLNDLTTGSTRVAALEIKEPGDIAFSPDGKLLGVPNYSGFASILDAATLHPRVTLRGSQSTAASVAFSRDGQRLVIGSTGKDALTLWDVESHEELLTLEGQGTVRCPPAFSPDGNVLGAMNLNGVLEFWRAPSWAEIEVAEKQAGK